MALPPIFDGHNDTLTSVYKPDTGPGRSFFERGDSGQLDLPRAVSGGLKGGIFAIFTPPPKSSPESAPHYGLTTTEEGYEVALPTPLETAYARAFTDAHLDFAHSLEAESAGRLGIVRSAGDLQRFLEQDRLAMVLHIEGAEAIEPDSSGLEHFYQKDVRSLGLVWSRPNAYGSGVPFRFPGHPDTGEGLTPAGKALVQACNRLGVVVDLVHLNERGFWDAARTSDAPLVVSHTAVHAICPSTRNLTDAQIDAVGQSGGLIGIMFEPMQIRPDGKPIHDFPLSVLARHVEYVANRIGVEHIALGSDFDGAGMPDRLKDASALPALLQALNEMGFHGEDLEKIAYRNWWRIFRETWK
jgi:membrane dipeptidase